MRVDDHLSRSGFSLGCCQVDASGLGIKLLRELKKFVHSRKSKLICCLYKKTTPAGLR